MDMGQVIFLTETKLEYDDGDTVPPFPIYATPTTEILVNIALI